MSEGRAGEFYAKGRTVWKSPTYQKTPTGNAVSIGFPICELHDAASDDAAEAIAAGLNMLFAEKIAADKMRFKS